MIYPSSSNTVRIVSLVSLSSAQPAEKVFLGKEPSATVTVPDITKMGIAAATKMISNYGLNLKLVGNESTKNTALIYSQTPAAGTVVEAGTVITAGYKNYDGVSN